MVRFLVLHRSLGYRTRDFCRCMHLSNCISQQLTKYYIFTMSYVILYCYRKQLNDLNYPVCLLCMFTNQCTIMTYPILKITRTVDSQAKYYMNHQSHSPVWFALACSTNESNYHTILYMDLEVFTAIWMHAVFLQR